MLCLLSSLSIAPHAYAEPASALSPASTTSTASAGSETIIKAPEWRGSLMFSLKDLARLYKVQESFRNQPPTKLQDTAADDFLTEILSQNPAQEAAPFRFPSFYLSSILYLSPKEWSVWINGKKLDGRKDVELENLTIQKISRTGVTLLWEPTAREMTELKVNWDQKIAAVAAGAWKLDPAIQYSPSQEHIAISLRPNQSFSSQTLEVIEGRIPPSFAAAAPPAAAPAPPPAEAPVEPATGPSGDGQAALPEEEQKIVNEALQKAMENSGMEGSPLTSPAKAVTTP